MTWSFSQLVKEHGEERALELLYTQKGYGEFEGPYHKPPQPKAESNTCPLCGLPLSSRKRCGPVDVAIPPEVS